MVRSMIRLLVIVALGTGTPRSSLASDKPILSEPVHFSRGCAVSADSKWLFVIESRKDEVLRWSLEDDSKPSSMKIADGMRTYLLGPCKNGNSILAASHGGGQNVVYRQNFDKRTGDLLLTCKGTIRSFLREEAVAVTMHDDPTVVTCIDLRSGEKKNFARMIGKRLEQVDFSPDGSLVLARNERYLMTVWDYPSGKERWQAKADQATIWIRFFPDSKRLYSNAGYVWDASTGKQVGQRLPANQPIFHPDGKHVAYQEPDRDKDAWVFQSIETRDVVGRIRRDPNVLEWAPRTAIFSPDGRFLVALATNSVNVWKTPELPK